MFTLTKINLLWDKVKSLTKKVDTMAQIPRGSVVVGLMDGSVSIPETARNEIGDAFKKNIPCFIEFSFSNTIKNMYCVTQCHYNGLNGELTEIIAIQMKKDAVGHYYIDAKASNSWSAEVTTVNPSEYTPLNYSTSEQDTGIKWIDNKEIYQKTIVLDDVVLVKNTWISTGISSGDISMVLDMEFIDNNNNPLSGVSLALIDGYINLMSYISTGLNVKTFTIRYTKTAPASNTESRTKKTTKKEEDNK